MDPPHANLLNLPGQSVSTIITTYSSQSQEKGIKFCEHKEELQVYSSTYNTALCNDCYFEKQAEWGTTLTLKQASAK